MRKVQSIHGVRVYVQMAAHIVYDHNYVLGFASYRQREVLVLLAVDAAILNPWTVPSSIISIWA